MDNLEEQRKKMIAAEKLLCSFKQAINELGFDFGCTEVKPVAAQPEKPARKIDRFNWIYDSNDDEVYRLIPRLPGQFFKCPLNMLDFDCHTKRLVATSPDAMRALIEFVNDRKDALADTDICVPSLWRYGGVCDKWMERFSKIITDAGFACDINQRSE